MMISFPPGSLIWVVVFVALIYSKIDVVYYALIFTSVLTTISFVNIGNDSILIFHVVFLIVILKFTVLHLKKKIIYSVDNNLIYFACWCLLTIPFSNFHRNIIVQNINSVYKHVDFSFQQITQYAYLLIALLTCFVGNSLLHDGKLQIEKMKKFLMYAYIFTLSVAALQLVVPPELINTFFRNSVHVYYNTYGARISGTFSEPSFLSLYCAPLFAEYFYLMFATPKLKYIFLSGMFIFVTLLNQSSSAALGIICTLAVVLLFGINAKRFTRSRLGIVIGLIILVIVFTIFNFDSIKEIYNAMLTKLNGGFESGSARLSSFLYHIKLAFKNILPTGYGTVRSFDLLSTWACSIGFVGLLLYFVPVIKLCIKLYKIGTNSAFSILISIIVHNVIMFASVCEVMYLSIWIFYGMGFYVVSKYESRKSGIIIETSCNDANNT